GRAGDQPQPSLTQMSPGPEMPSWTACSDGVGLDECGPADRRWLPQRSTTSPRLPNGCETNDPGPTLQGDRDRQTMERRFSSAQRRAQQPSTCGWQPGSCG